MRLESLSLRGILRFADTIAIDFRDLPPGLIALVGPNGAGKTTLMEAPLAGLYRQFPSRSREAFDYATRTDAYIESTFELEGRGLYRSRLNLDGPHRKAEATLSQILPDGRAVILNDGKVSTYDACIRGLLPRYEDLLASVFAAQNRNGAFSSLDMKGRRELFASLLGLDHYEDLAQRARRAVERVTQEIERQSAARDLLARDAGKAIEDLIEREAQRLQVDLGTVELRREELSRLIGFAELALSGLQSDLTAHASAVARRDRLEAELLGTRAARVTQQTALERAAREGAEERGRLNVALSQALARLETECRDTRDFDRECKQITAALSSVLEDAEKRIAANEGLRARADQIRAADAAVKVLDAQIDENRTKQADAQAAVDAAVAAHGALFTRRAPKSVTQSLYTRALSDAALLTNVPCRGEGEFSVCGFLQTAKNAAKVVAASAGIDAEMEAIDAEIAAVETRHLACKADLSALVKATRSLLEERTRHQTLAAELPHLTEAEAKIEAHTRRITEAQQQAEAGLAAAEAREHERQTRIAGVRDRQQQDHTAAIVALDGRLAAQQARDLAALDQLDEEAGRTAEARASAAQEAQATHDAAERADIEQAKLVTYRSEWDGTTKRLATVEAQAVELHTRRDALLARRAELDAVEATIEVLRADLVDWSVLGKAMSRDGLPTIEIDQAGPTVSAYANDLLQACFGGRFSIELVTQAPKTTKGKDGSTHKEVFRANIYDQQRAGEARELEDLSGGERVIVEEVLRSAIALLVNQRNQQPMRTLWRDETTGALDPENAERYIVMLRRLQEVGEFHQVFFVSHNPDCARLADAQIRVDDGAVAIALPPFAAADEAPLVFRVSEVLGVKD